MKPRHSKQLNTMRAYRLPPILAHSLYTAARRYNLSESEFVRMLLQDGLDRLN
jgi:hypothetical protein